MSISISVRPSRFPLVAVLALLVGCEEIQSPVAEPADTPGPTGTPEAPQAPGAPSAPLSVVIVSNPAGTGGPAIGSDQVTRSVRIDIVYASLAPGTVPEGERIVIRTRATGTEVTTALVDGGFDPIAIPATVGDTLDVRLYLVDQTEPEESISVVPERRPPVLVRVDPPPGRRDVPLNAVLLLVFSEPIDAATLTPSSVSLSRDGSPVAGALAFVDETGLAVTLTPDSPLTAGADYTLLVTETIRDLDSDALEAPVTGTFTTADAAPISNQISNQIVFVRDFSDIYVMDEDGSNLIDLTSTSDEYYSTAVSPDGTRIAFDVGYAGFGSDVFVMNADGTGRINLTDGGFGGPQDFGPAWSPDGTRIVFASDRHNFRSTSNSFSIYVMNSNGSGLTRLTNQPGHDWDPSWSPDGTRIAFTSGRDGDSEIYVMNADGSNQTNLTNSAGVDGRPAWSPDGTRVVFISQRDGDPEVYVMNADGSGQTNLTNQADFDSYPSWSPNGSQILFATNRDGDFEVYVMNADGSDQTNLTNAPASTDIPGSPQGWR